MFLYNFTKYIEWPGSPNNFTIGVLGGNPAAVAAFERMVSTKSGGGRNYRVTSCPSPEAAANCQVLFIPVNQSGALPTVLEMYKGKPLLIVTEKTGLANQGSLINFVMQGGKLRFEVNQSAIENNRLKISSQLLSLAIKV